MLAIIGGVARVALVWRCVFFLKECSFLLLYNYIFVAGVCLVGVINITMSVVRLENSF